MLKDLSGLRKRKRGFSSEAERIQQRGSEGNTVCDSPLIQHQVPTEEEEVIRYFSIKFPL